jgi:putative endonuclease
MKYYYTYIITHQKDGITYIGTTANLARRVEQHKYHASSGVSGMRLDRLIWYKRFDSVQEAIQCEKSLKSWSVNLKKDLIEQKNPEWRDLSDDILHPDTLQKLVG